MVTIGMNYRVIEGKQEAFISMFDKVIELMRDNEGHAQSNLFVDVHDGCSFLILSQWRRKAAFDAFISSETFAKVATWGREQILSARPKHEVFGEDE